LGLDFAVVFKKPISFEERISAEFTPFSRALSNFFYANYYGEDSTFDELEKLLKTDVKYLIGPNLFDFEVDEMQLEFAEGIEREKLLERQKELEQNSHKAWKSISGYLTKLNDTINIVAELNNLNQLIPNTHVWHKYIRSGEFIADLKKLMELLSEADDNRLEKFTFQIY
jgi:hypothetical protein